jgi:hypothetical protein
MGQDAGPVRRLLPLVALAGALLAACERSGLEPPSEPETVTVRVATFNVEELSLDKLAQVDETGRGTHPQLAAAAVIERVRPEILVLNEVDFLAEEPLRTARLFVERYLARGDDAIDYPHLFAAPTNTGLLSGHDLDDDGVVATAADRGTREHGGDSWGFGTYPGQYGMALLSQHPIVASEVRTFQTFLWRDLPGNHLPVEFYDLAETSSLRLSSKSHWDVPVEVAGTELHIFVSHPTPPAFDGDEDRNGRRNFDEIGFWVAYLDGSPALYDDAGRRGGFDPPGGDAPFVIAGDLNARPDVPADEGPIYDGRTAISQLLDHPEIQDPAAILTSRGAEEHAAASSSASPHPERATAEFLGGARVDYLLPGSGLEVANGGIFWPAAGEDSEGHRLADEASDHRLVWLDLVLPPR